MNKLTTWVAVIAVVVALYLGATWMIGRSAYDRINEFTEQTTKQLQTILKVADRKTSNSFFGSTEDITFELNGTAATAFASYSQRAGTKTKPEFTVRNVIQYGPFPGFTNVGFARIKSEPVLTDEIRKWMKETLGTDRPVELSIVFGFFGNARASITSPALKVRDPKDDWLVEWKGMNIVSDYSNNLHDVKLDGSIPGLVIMSGNGAKAIVDAFAIKADLRQKFDGLYVGNESITLGSVDVQFAPGTQSNVLVKDIYYAIDLSADAEFFNGQARIGAKSLQVMPIALNGPYFDFKMTRLHGPTLASMIKKFQEINEGINGGAAPDPAALEPLKADAIALLKYSPELVIERLGFSTSDGEMKIAARITFEDITTADFEPTFDPSQLGRKAHFVADASIAQSLVDHWPIGTARDAQRFIDQYIQQGLAVQKGDQIESHLELKSGVVTANGKQLGGANERR